MLHLTRLRFDLGRQVYQTGVRLHCLRAELRWGSPDALDPLSTSSTTGQTRTDLAITTRCRRTGTQLRSERLTFGDVVNSFYVASRVPDPFVHPGKSGPGVGSLTA